MPFWDSQGIIEGMKKAEEHKQAFALYVHQGFSLRKITTILDVSRSSLERWCRDGEWVKRRNEHWSRVSQELCQNTVYEHLGNQKSVAGELEKMFIHIHEQHRAYVEGKLPRKALKYGVRDLCQIATAINQIHLCEVKRADVIANIQRKN